MTTLTRKQTVISMVILAAMFFIFGFVSWVNSILIPYFRIACELTHFQSYFVTFAFYIAYFVMAIPSGRLLDRVGFKRGIMYGFMFMAAGMFVFVPAALTRTFGIFLAGLFMIGTGLAILQTAANPYVTIVGPIESAARRISIVGICNKLAGIISPLVFAAVILKASDAETFRLIEQGAFDPATKAAVLDELIRRVIVPYSILGAALLAFGIFIRHSVLPEIDTTSDNTSCSARLPSSSTSVRRSSQSTLSSNMQVRWGWICLRRRYSRRTLSPARCWATSWASSLSRE